MADRIIGSIGKDMLEQIRKKVIVTERKMSFQKKKLTLQWMQAMPLLVLPLGLEVISRLQIPRLLALLSWPTVKSM